MFFLLDHLTSILAGAAVILILATVQIGAQRTSLEQTTSYATKTKMLSFGEWMEDDILSLGANFGRNRFRFEPPQHDANGNTTRFVFFSDSVLVSGDTLRLMTRYRLYPTRTVTRGGREVDLYEVRRHTAQMPVNNGVAGEPGEGSGPGNWTYAGQSLSTLAGFEIRLLQRDGSETTDPERGDFIQLHFRVVPEYPIEPEYLRELYWTNTLKVKPFWEPPPEAG